MSRKSIGAQIRSVFNIADPYSREFSDDSDDETIVDKSSILNSTQDSQLSVDYLSQYPGKNSTSLFVNYNNTLSPNKVTSGTSYNYNCPASGNIKSEVTTCSASLNKIHQEYHCQIVAPNVSSNDDKVDIKINTSLNHNTSKDLRREYFQNILSRKSFNLSNSQLDDILAPDTPVEDVSRDLFEDSIEIIMDSDVSIISNNTQHTA